MHAAYSAVGLEWLRKRAQEWLRREETVARMLSGSEREREWPVHHSPTHHVECYVAATTQPRPAQVSLTNHASHRSSEPNPKSTRSRLSPSPFQRLGADASDWIVNAPSADFASLPTLRPASFGYRTRPRLRNIDRVLASF